MDLCRTIAAERPAAFNIKLAISLGKLSNCLSNHGHHEEALAADQEAVALCRILAEERPATFNSDLLMALSLLSLHLSILHQHEEALAAGPALLR